MKPKFIIRLIDCLMAYYKKKQLKEKIKARVEADPTSNFNKADFLNDKKGKRK